MDRSVLLLSDVSERETYAASEIVRKRIRYAVLECCTKPSCTAEAKRNPKKSTHFPL
jgi:hypothetical protein